jgi:indole-3-glycerol phosphate synthase
VADIPDILQRILAVKREEVSALRASPGEAALRARVRDAGPVRDFAGAITARAGARALHGAAVIAEIKKASPSRGVLRPDFDPPAIARSYERHGAACLSVLTDRKFFQGDLADLASVRDACSLPLLRKDFLVDELQVLEARAAGADAILLIAAALEPARLSALEDAAAGLGMAVLVEVHDERELDLALALRTPLLGINNRDLRSFEVSLAATFDLLARIPPGRCVVTESGILAPADVARMRAAGVHAFLVGEAFMRAPDPGAELARLFA